MSDSAGSSKGKGVKNDAGKYDPTFIPTVAIRECARAFQFGARKYSPFNYENGLSARRLLAAAKRHIDHVLDGEELDTEVWTDPKTGEQFSSGAHHLGHALASLAMYLRCRELGRLDDDRSPNRVQVVAAPVSNSPFAILTAAPVSDHEFKIDVLSCVDGYTTILFKNFPKELRGIGRLGAVNDCDILSHTAPAIYNQTGPLYLPGNYLDNDNHPVRLATSIWTMEKIKLIEHIVANALSDHYSETKKGA